MNIIGELINIDMTEAVDSVVQSYTRPRERPVWDDTEKGVIHRNKRYRYTPSLPLGLKADCWLDAAEYNTISEAGGLVSQWDDKSGNGNHATQPTGALQPVTGVYAAKLNRLNAISFNGGQDLNLMPVELDGQFSIFMVLTPTSGTEDYIISTDGPGGWPAIVSGYNSLAFEYFGESPRFTIAETAVGGQVVSAIVSEDSVSAYLNGAWTGPSTFGSNVSFTGRAFNTIGAASNGNGRFHGQIGEIIIFKRSVDEGERLGIEAYLTRKWGIPNNRRGDELGWTPARIPTGLWLDAADAGTITEAAGFVSQWDDKSGNGNHFVQPVGDSQPTTGVVNVNSINAIDFNGDMQRFLTSTTGELNVVGRICFAVIKTFEEDTSGHVLSSRIDNNQALRRSTLGGYLPSLSYHDGVQTEYASHGFTFGTPELLAVSYGSSSAEIYINGVLEHVGIFSGSMLVSQIGRLQTGTVPNHFCVAEIVITAENSGVTRQRVDYYLRKKWGI